MAFGEEICLQGIADAGVVQAVADKIDAQIWRLYRLWESNRIAHALLTQGSQDLHTPYAQDFLGRIASQVDGLQAMGLPGAQAREALLQLYAQPVFNAQRAAALQPASRSQGKA